MKKQLLLLVMILLPMVASADAVEIDGFYYNLIPKAKIAEVTSNPDKYTGDVVIPELVTYEGTDYIVTSIGEKAFYWCFDLTSVIIPNNVTSIGEEAFERCSGLTSITIPNSVMSIGSDAFCLCSGLTSVTIPNSVMSIGGHAFSGCSGLTSVTLGNSVTSIEGGAFAGCSGLTSVDIPNSVTSIGSDAFANCSGLASVTIPNSVTSIGDNAFWACSSLTSVTIPNSVTSIGYFAFYDCSNLTSVTIPNSVTSIGYMTFQNCSALTSVTIPNSVTSIGIDAFRNCSALTSVTIGSGIEYIEDKAFSSCSELTDVYCYAINVPNTNTDAFKDSYIEYSTLHVPDGSIDAYSAAEPWKNFNKIVKIMPSYILTYMVDGEVYKSYETEEGEDITPEPAPTKEGYTFSGWSDIPETMPAHDVTVTGSFTINKYKLTYMVDETEYKSYEIEYGAAITPELAPTKEGYTFSGWSEIPETMPAHDVTVTGTFTINKYKLTYMVDDEEYKSYDVEYGGTVTPEPAPTKEGYTFSGWSEIPATMPAHDVTVTGSFAVNQYIITYIIDNEVYTTQTVDYGSTIVPPTAPEREGYDFAWGDYPETMPAYDITIYGTYTTGIEAIMAGETNCQIFSLDGKPLNELQKGVNIIRMSNGQVHKIVVNQVRRK